MPSLRRWVYGVLTILFLLAVTVAIGAATTSILNAESEPLMNASNYVMEENAADTLRDRWVAEQNQNRDEYFYCLDAEKSDGTVTFSNPVEREYVERSPEHVIVQGTCNQGSVHPHFNRICSASRQDAFIFGKYSDQVEFKMIQCGPHDFRAYYADSNHLRSVEVTPQ